MKYSNMKWRNIKTIIFITSDSSSKIIDCQPYDRKQLSFLFQEFLLILIRKRERERGKTKI